MCHHHGFHEPIQMAGNTSCTFNGAHRHSCPSTHQRLFHASSSHPSISPHQTHQSSDRLALSAGGSEQDGDLLGPSRGSPLGWMSLAGSSAQFPRSCSTSFEALSNLPTEGTRLEHRTRGRPRPPRSIPYGGFRSSVSGAHSLLGLALSLFGSLALPLQFGKPSFHSF